MKKLIITALFIFMCAFTANAVTIQELNIYNGYMQIPNAMQEQQFAPVDVHVIGGDDPSKLEIVAPVYGYMQGNFIITELVKHFYYDFRNYSITMEITETNLIDGRNGKVLRKGVYKKPKTVELQQGTYGFMEAMIMLGNAQRAGKFTPPTIK